MLIIITWNKIKYKKAYYIVLELPTHLEFSFNLTKTNKYKLIDKNLDKKYVKNTK